MKFASPKPFKKAEPSNEGLIYLCLTEMKVHWGVRIWRFSLPAVHSSYDDLYKLRMEILCIYPIFQILDFIFPDQSCSCLVTQNNVIGIFIVMAAAWAF